MEYFYRAALVRAGCLYSPNFRQEVFSETRLLIYLTHLTQNLGGNELTQRWSKLKSIMNRDLLELYSDYLLSSFSYTTATGLSAMTGGVVSHDKIRRFLTAEQLDTPTMRRLVTPLVRDAED